MKKSLFIAITVAVLFAPSCKKKEENPPVYPKPCTTRVATLNNGDANDSTDYIYSGGKIAAIVVFNLSTKALMDSTTFSYGGSSIIAKKYDNTKTLKSSSEITLGSNGYASKELITNIIGSSYDTDTITYEYNSDGYLTQSVANVGNLSTTTTRTITSGNVTKISTTNVYGTNDKDFTYFADKANKAGMNEDGLFTESFYGKPSNNLVNTVTLSGPSGNFSYNMYYTLDNNGYITQILNGSAPVYIMTYKCQ